MNRIPHLRLCLALLAAFFLTGGCGIYSFSGTYPALANQLTESLNDKFRKLTKLEQVPDAGDLNLLVTIDSYDVRATAVTAGDVAAMNRLTVTCKVVFTNTLHPEDNLEQSFAGYEDYDSNNSLDMVESQLCDAIIQKIVDDIFNATVAQW